MESGFFFALQIFDVYLERVKQSVSIKDTFFTDREHPFCLFPTFPFSKKWEWCKEKTGQTAFLFFLCYQQIVASLMSWSMLIFALSGMVDTENTRVPVTPVQYMHSKRIKLLKLMQLLI